MVEKDNFRSRFYIYIYMRGLLFLLFSSFGELIEEQMLPYYSIVLNININI